MRKKLIHLLNNSKEVIGDRLHAMRTTLLVWLLTFAWLWRLAGNPPLLATCILLVPDVLLPNDDELARSFTLALSEHFVNSADQGTALSTTALVHRQGKVAPCCSTAIIHRCFVPCW
jgi:hypothetical protein